MISFKQLSGTLFVAFVALSNFTGVVSDDSSENREELECGDSEPGDKTCSSKQETVCHPKSRCYDPASQSVYRHGGSAQAYKQNAPIKSTVCENRESSLKVASWPFTRRALTGQAPVLSVRGRLWACSAEGEKCCCRELQMNRDSIPKVQVWQARPDGTYSSLTSSESADCRATVPTVGSNFEFQSLLPGSTGSFGGLGPFGWDNFPYGPPTLHFLISAKGYNTLLADVPVVPDRSLGRSSFWGPDLRGKSLGSSSIKVNPPYEINTWNVGENGDIQLEIDFFLTGGVGLDSPSLEQTLCPSQLYFLPSSFFFQPIELCAPSLLDFFDL